LFIGAFIKRKGDNVTFSSEDTLIFTKQEVSMKKLVFGILAIALALPLAAETWKDVALMDAGCATHKEKTDAPDAHTKTCALRCGEKGGYGALVDGKFIKFDKNGDDLTTAALKKTEKTDHLRADITGEMKEGKMVVSAIEVK